MHSQSTHRRARQRLVATIMRPLAQTAVRFRVERLPLSREQAGWWGHVLNDYPSLFDGFGYDLRTRTEVFPDVWMTLALRERIQRLILATGRWDRIVEETMRSVLSPGSTFVDVGANVGYFTLLASRLVADSGRVLAFEPYTRVLQQLAAHVVDNNARNVILFGFGLSETDGFARFSVSSRDNTGEGSLRKLDDETGALTVLTYRLDTLAAAMALNHTLIKIDIEGAELLALRGMRDLLCSRSPILVCEVVDTFLRGMGTSERELIDFMAAVGYIGLYEERLGDAGGPTERVRWRRERTELFLPSRIRGIPGGHMLFVKGELPDRLKKMCDEPV